MISQSPSFGFKRWRCSSSSSILADTTCVLLSAASQVHCPPINFHNMVDLKFSVRVPNLCQILQFRPNQSFLCNFPCTRRCKSHVLAKTAKFVLKMVSFGSKDRTKELKLECASLLCDLEKTISDVLTPFDIISDVYATYLGI